MTISTTSSEPLDSGLPADSTPAAAGQDPAAGQASAPTSAPVFSPSQEMLALQKQLAELSEENTKLKERSTSAPEEMQLYNNPAHRTLLLDTLGEEAVGALESTLRFSIGAQRAKAEKQVSALEKRTHELSHQAKQATFIRSVPKEAMDTFNSEAFQTYAEGEKLGRRTLKKELADIIDSGDMEGVQFLIEQTAAFNGAGEIARKSSVPVIGAGRPVSRGQGNTQVFDEVKASQLQREFNRYKPSDTGYDSARKALQDYLTLTT